MGKRKGTRNEQAWRYIPVDIWRERHRLADMGVSKLARKSQSWQVSLGTADREEAVGRKAVLEDEWRAEEAQWRQMLRDGPASLSEMDALIVAQQGAARRWAQHKASPIDAPYTDQAFYPRPAFTPSEVTRSILKAMSPEEREAALREGLEAAKRLIASASDPMERQRVLREVRNGKGYPWCFPEFRELGIRMLEERRGEATSEDLSAAGIGTADAWSRFMVSFEGLGAEQQLRQSLEARAGGDLSAPQWVADAEREGAEWQRQRRPDSGGRALTFEAIIAEEERLSGLRLEGHAATANTLRIYRNACRQFAKWRGSDNALTVTLAEAEQWRDELIAKADSGESADKRASGRKDARGKAQNIRSVIGWAITHSEEARARGGSEEMVFPEGNPLEKLKLPKVPPRDSSEHTYSVEQVARLLKAARLEERAERRWLPWLIAHTGMRLEEASQMERADIIEYQGIWYCMVRYRMGATLAEDRIQKGKSNRRIPLHRALVAEGFVAWVQQQPDGRLFRCKALSNRLREWIHGVFPEGLGTVQPVHGLRHLFEDLILRWPNERAQNYVAGRGIKGSAGSYGQSEAIVPTLSKLMDEIPPFLPMPDADS